MMKKGVLTTILLFGLISGCLAPGGKVEMETNPEVVAIKTGDDSPVDSTRAGDHSPIVKVKAGDESPVDISLKNEEFSYGTLWKIGIVVLGVLGILGFDCWVCKRWRSARKCK
jgi:hypothetical protein